MKTHLAPFVTACLISNASSQEPAFDVNKYLAASSEYEVLAQEAQAHQTMPRIANPRAAAILKTLSDPRILAIKKYETGDLNFLSMVCGRVNDISVSYTLTNAKGQIDPKSAPADIVAQLQILMQQNLEEFQDEIAITQPFAIRCFATQLPLIAEMLDSLPPEKLTDIRVNGIHKIKDGTMAMYGSIGIGRTRKYQGGKSIGNTRCPFRNGCGICENPDCQTTATAF